MSLKENNNSIIPTAFSDNDGNIVRESSFLDDEGNIDWNNFAPFEGFVCNDDGPVIKIIKITKYDSVDRYGKIPFASSRYVCPVINNNSYSYEQRSLPYSFETVEHFIYNVHDNHNVHENYDCPEEIKNAIFKKYNIENYEDLLECQEGTVADAFNQCGGATQIKLKISVIDYIALGIMELSNNENK